MKNIIFSLTTVFISLFSLKAQDSLNKLQIGFDFLIGNNALGRENIYPSITLSKAKHTAFIGPAFIYGLYYNPYAPSFGLQAGYQYYPNGKKNRFNLFFEYDFNWVKAKFQINHYSWNQTGLKKRNIEISSLDNYLGFGFRLNIIKGLYLKTNLGLGLIFYRESTKDELYDGTIIAYNDTGKLFAGKFYPFTSQYIGYELYPWRQNQLIGIFKIGLGWDLYSFKKS